MNCRAYADYRSGESLAYWRSKSGFEVDFILGDHTAIEVKAARSVSGRDPRSLRALADDRPLQRSLCVCLEERPRAIEGVQVVPCREFLTAHWSDEYR